MTRDQRNKVRRAMVIAEGVRAAGADRRLSSITVEREMREVNVLLIAALCNCAPVEVDDAEYKAEVTVARAISDDINAREE